MQSALVDVSWDCSQEYSKGKTWGHFTWHFWILPVEFVRVLTPGIRQCRSEPSSAIYLLCDNEKKIAKASWVIGDWPHLPHRVCKRMTQDKVSKAQGWHTVSTPEGWWHTHQAPLPAALSHQLPPHGSWTGTNPSSHGWELGSEEGGSDDSV